MSQIVCPGRRRNDGGPCRTILGELLDGVYVLRNDKRQVQVKARDLDELLCRRCRTAYRDGARVLVVSASGADRELAIGVAS